ncbi:MAG: amidohydrolase family protein [Halodesulfurarchaeum sp.]
MAEPADAIFVDGEIHVRPGSDRIEEALAVRDGTVCRVADTYEVEFLEGIETRRVDLAGRTVLPGFVDGHADLSRVGKRLDESGKAGERSAPAGIEQARDVLMAALDDALEQGVTTVSDAVRNSETARAYHELARAEELPIRTRLNYREDAGSVESPAPLDAATRLGLGSDVGTGRLCLESLGVDVDDGSANFVKNFLRRSTESDFRVSVTVDDPAALSPLLSALDGSDVTRPRIWLGGAVSDEQVPRLAGLGATVVGNPGSGSTTGGRNPGEVGAGETRGLQFGRLVAAGVPVAFGSNGRRPIPLRSIERATGASPEDRLGVTEAVRAATGGTGPPATPESGTGTLDAGTSADFVALSASPWETPIGQLDVELTVVDGTIEYDPS